MTRHAFCQINIKKFLNDHNLNITQAADASNMSRSAISNLSNGAGSIQPSTLDTLFEKIHCAGRVPANEEVLLEEWEKFLSSIFHVKAIEVPDAEAIPEA